MNWSRLIDGFLKARIIRHLLFWGLSFWIILNLTAPQVDHELIDYLFTGLFHLSLLTVVYLNLKVNMPLLMRKERYGWYGLATIGAIAIGVTLNWFTYQYLSDWVLPGYYFISEYNLWERTQFMTAYLAISTLLHLSQAWFEVNRTKQRLDQLENEKVRAELAGLQAQVNPHFLFNTLHNLHSLARQQHPQTADTVLRLAGMLRYMTYEAQKPMVPLAMEVEYLQNYVELQQLRVGEEADISLNVTGTLAHPRIAPLLLIPLLENAFKHGRPSEGESYLHANLWSEPDRIRFFVENGKVPLSEVEDNPSGGQGLSNLTQRLELTYPGRHLLQFTDLPDRFSVQLEIQL